MPRTPLVVSGFFRSVYRFLALRQRSEGGGDGDADDLTIELIRLIPSGNRHIPHPVEYRIRSGCYELVGKSRIRDVGVRLRPAAEDVEVHAATGIRRILSRCS